MISVGREARANASGLARISALYQKGGRSVGSDAEPSSATSRS